LGFVGAYVFAKKGYRPGVGALIGVLFGPLGLLASLLIPRTSAAIDDAKEGRRLNDELAAARKQKRCPECGCSHSVINQFCPSCMHKY
jgi:hypothetical protein